MADPDDTSDMVILSSSPESAESWSDAAEPLVTQFQDHFGALVTVWGYAVLAFAAGMLYSPNAAGIRANTALYWIQITATILAFHDYLTYQTHVSIGTVADSFPYASHLDTTYVRTPAIVLMNGVFAYPMFAYGDNSVTYLADGLAPLVTLIGFLWFPMFLFGVAFRSTSAESPLWLQIVSTAFTHIVRVAFAGLFCLLIAAYLYYGIASATVPTEMKIWIAASWALLILLIVMQFIADYSP